MHPAHRYLAGYNKLVSLRESYSWVLLYQPFKEFGQPKFYLESISLQIALDSLLSLGSSSIT